MTNRSLSFYLFFILSCNGYAQQTNPWMLGYNQSGMPNPINSIYAVDFSSGTIIYDTAHTTAFSFRSCNSSISDSAGNLLFYTNGIVVMNAVNDTMVNGDSLSYSEEVYDTGINGVGMIYPQTILILPAPAQPNIYYLLHQTFYFHPVLWTNEYCDTLFYSIVDMTQDSGRGAIIEKNHVLWTGNLLINDLVTIGGMSACKHANGRDWWIVTHKDSSNIFMNFLLTPFGISGPFLQTINPIVKFTMMQAGFSPDGTKYAYNNNSGVHLFNFDRCTGTFSAHKNLGLFSLTTFGSLGTCFSPNSEVLYASGGQEIYQWDLTASNVQSTKATVCLYDSFACPVYGVLFYQMQRAIDGNIYVSSPNSSYCLSVINDPNVLGPGCNAVAHGLSNLPYYNGASIPYYPEFNLGAEPGSACDSLTSLNSNIVLNSFEIFPNPASDELFIKYTVKDRSQLKLFTATGDLVFSIDIDVNSTQKKVQLDIQSGFYFWELKSASVAQKGKLVIIK